MAKPNALAGLAAQVEQESISAILDSPGRIVTAQRAPMGRRPVEKRDEPTSRESRKAMTFYFPPEVSRGLKALALIEDTTMQALIGEAIDELMRSRGRHPFGAR